MPLFKKKVFTKAPLPIDLRINEEVFYCTMTNEIFREYEDYCQRVILCNSMVWSCSYTGKTGLTYSEALESEKNAQKIANDFPSDLKLPVLYLASKTQRTLYSEVVEDVFSFMKDRYFVGENVEASFNGIKWRESHILQVISPSEEEIDNYEPKNGSPENKHNNTHIPSILYKYEVEQLDSEDEDISEVMIVDYHHIRRRKNHLSREKIKLYLKQFIEQNEHNIHIIQKSVLKSFGIDKLNFQHIFDGPIPTFECSKLKRLPRNTSNGKRLRQERLTDFLSKNNGISRSKQASELAERAKQREEKIQLLKQRSIEAKLAEKQKRKEEKVEVSLLLKDWYKPKEDLELEDQKKLPVPHPLVSKIPQKHLGEVLSILEFVHSFSKFLQPKDFFPNGLNFKLMERALLKKEVAGPLVDLFRMFLVSLFNINSEESSICPMTIDTTVKELKRLDVEISPGKASKYATCAARWSKTHQGFELFQLPINSLTVTEVLRLHLLSSGSRVREIATKWRYQHRGGYMSEDDPAIYLRLTEPHLLKKLALYTISEFTISQKLKLLDCLMNQLLTFADVRDCIEDRKQALIDLKALQISERRREQEYVSTKHRLQKEDAKTEIGKLEQENEAKKLEANKQMEVLIAEVQQNQNLLGQDRAFRRYLKLESIPGVFVNCEEENSGECLNKKVKQVVTLIDADRSDIIKYIRKINGRINTSDKENHEEESKENESIKVNGVNTSLLQEDEDSLLLCSADPEKCIVHSKSRKRLKWAYYEKPEEIEALCNSLNNRGIRESELKQVINHDKDYLVSLVSKTPFNILYSEEDTRVGRNSTKYKNAYLGYSPSLSIMDILQSALVDVILELEEKIYEGNLGALEVNDRLQWRTDLLDRQFDRLDKSFDKMNNEKVTERDYNCEGDEYRDPGFFLNSTSEQEQAEDELDIFLTEDHKLAIQTLAIALLQVGQGVERKHLKKPLGSMGKLKLIEKAAMFDKWKESLLASTSYSQLFLHESTLNSCVFWSRSVLLAHCRVCGKENDSENMLICDGCNNGYHIYCLKPKLTNVPDNDWYCKSCNKKRIKKARREIQLQRQVKKRRIFIEEISDVETDNNNVERHDEDAKSVNSTKDEEVSDNKEEAVEDIQSSAESDQDDILSISSEREVCKKCNTGGTLICCDNCPDMYHLDCAEPPVKRVLRGDWFCHKCKSRKNRDGDHGILNGESSSRRNNRRDCDSWDNLPLHNAPLQELLADVLRQDCAWPFIRPVHKFEVPDYYDIITKPMDFGTIKYKLNMGEYKCDAEVMADASLVFENCNTYNNSEDEVYKCGVKLHAYFVKRSKKLGLQLPGSLENWEEATSKSPALVQPNEEEDTNSETRVSVADNDDLFHISDEDYSPDTKKIRTE